MALNVGELEATLKLKDQMSAELTKANAKIKDFGQSMTQTGQSGTSSMSSLSSSALKLAGALGIGFSVAAVIKFGKAVFDDADALTKLHDKTNISVQGLQRMRIAGDDAGVTLDSMTTSINMMQKRLAGDDKSAVAALQQMGVDIGALRNLAPDQQFMEIAEAIRDIQDPAEQVNAAMAVFGRSGAELLPVIKRGFDDVRDASVGMSAGTVKALDDVGDTMTRWMRAFKGWAGETVGVWLQGGELRALANDVTIEYNEMAASVKRATPFLKDFSKATDGVALSEGEANLVIDRLNETLKKNGESVKKAADKSKELAESYANLGSLSSTWKQVLTSVDGKVLEGIKYYVERGAKVEDVARVYGLLPAKVEAVKGALEEEKKILEKAAEATEQINSANRNMVVGLKDLQEALPLPTFNAFVGYMEKLPTVMMSGVVGTSKLVHELKTNLMGVLKSMPQTIADAFTGGGGLLGALKSLGSQAGSAFGEHLGKSISNATKGIGSLAGPIGAALGSLAGPLIGKITGLFTKSENKETNNLRDQFMAAAGGLSLLNERAHAAGLTLDRVLNAKNPKDYEAAIKDLNAALAFQDQAMQTLDATVQKYGFTIDQLGPRFRQQKLDEQAAALFQDYQILIAAGIENVAVLDKMAPAMNSYIQTIVTAGGTIPEQLRGPIEKLIEMGLLTDAAGQKMTDVSQLTFAETLDAKFMTLIETIQKLVEAIGRTSGAIAAIPRDVDIELNARWNVPERPNFEGEGFASGTLGKTGSFFQNFGAGTPTVLHGTEAVVRPDQAGAFARQYGGDRRLDDILSELTLQRSLMPLAIRDALARA